MYNNQVDSESWKCEYCEQKGTVFISYLDRPCLCFKCREKYLKWWGNRWMVKKER